MTTTAAAPGDSLMQAAFETLLVISPFIFAAIFRNTIGFPYLGPIAIVIGVVIASLLLRRRNISWRDLGFKRPDKWWRIVIAAIATWIAIGLVTNVVIFPIIQALEIAPIDLSALALIRDGGLLTFLIFVGPLAWGTAAFGEEFIARGFILNRFAGALGQNRTAWAAAVVIQGIIFGLAHSWQGPTGILTISIIGMIFGLAYLLCGRNLWVTILAHGLIDSVSIIAIYVGVPIPG